MAQKPHTGEFNIWDAPHTRRTTEAAQTLLCCSKGHSSHKLASPGFLHHKIPKHLSREGKIQQKKYALGAFQRIFLVIRKVLPDP